MHEPVLTGTNAAAHTQCDRAIRAERERANRLEADLAAIAERIGGLNDGESLLEAIGSMADEHEQWSKTIGTTMYRLDDDLAAARAEAAELRAALIETVKHDDGLLVHTYRSCRICLWSERDPDYTEHQEHCPLARLERGAEVEG